MQNRVDNETIFFCLEYYFLVKKIRTFLKNYVDAQNIWVETARKGKGPKIGNFTLYVLGSLDQLYIFLLCWKLSCV